MRDQSLNQTCPSTVLAEGIAAATPSIASAAATSPNIATAAAMIPKEFESQARVGVDNQSTPAITKHPTTPILSKRKPSPSNCLNSQEDSRIIVIDEEDSPVLKRRCLPQHPRSAKTPSPKKKVVPTESNPVISKNGISGKATTPLSGYAASTSPIFSFR